MSVYTNNILHSRKGYSTFSMLLAIYFCTMLFDVFKIGGAGTLLKFYAIGLIFVAALSIKTNALVLDKLYFCKALYLCVCFASLLYSINFSASLSVFISIALNFALIMVCELVPCTQSENAMLRRALLLGSVLVIAATFLFADYSDGGRMTISILSDMSDPNYLNGYILFAFGYSAYNAVSLGKYRLLNLLACAGMLYFTLLTGSRGALLAEIAIILTSLVINFAKTGRKTKYVIFVSLFFVICILVFDYLLVFLPPEVAERFSVEFLKEEGTSSRSEIWTALLSRFFEDDFFSVLFGHGIGTSAFYNIFDNHVAHNAFIDILIGTGIVGVLTYISIFALTIKKAWKSKNYFMVAVLIGFVVMSMSLSLITYKPIFSALLYVELYYRTYRRRIRNETRIVAAGTDETD